MVRGRWPVPCKSWACMGNPSLPPLLASLKGAAAIEGPPVHS